MAGVKGARASKLSARGAPSVTSGCMRLWKGLDAGGIPAGWVPTAGMLVDRSLVTELTIRFDAGGHAEGFCLGPSWLIFCTAKQRTLL
jgi:hypothetical protein